MSAIAERLGEALEGRGMTAYGLAKATHRPPYAVCGWLKGAREPNAESIRRICYALEISADWLLGLDLEEELYGD